MTRVCSIDVGKVNLGVYIEEFTEYETGKGLYLRRVDLTESKKERVSVVFLRRLFDYLDTLTIDCDYYVIEKQLRANPEAQFVDHALQSYFVLKGKNVVSFSSKNKTKLFDDTKMTKYQRKKWSVVKAQQLLLSRGETELLDYLSGLKKKDDAADAICQLDAWKTIHFLKLKQISAEKVDQLHLERSKIEIPGPKRGKKKAESVDEKPKKKTESQASAPVSEKPVKGRKKKSESQALEPVAKKSESQALEPVAEKPLKGRKKKSESQASAMVDEKPVKGRKKKSESQASALVDEKPKNGRKKKSESQALEPVAEKPVKGRKKKSETQAFEPVAKKTESQALEPVAEKVI